MIVAARGFASFPVTNLLLGADRDRGRRHRLARSAGSELRLVCKAALEQPAEEPAVMRLGASLFDEDVGL
jgi:hypothetical protein